MNVLDHKPTKQAIWSAPLTGIMQRPHIKEIGEKRVTNSGGYRADKESCEFLHWTAMAKLRLWVLSVESMRGRQ